VSTPDGKDDVAKPGFLRRYLRVLDWLAPRPAADLHRCQLCSDDSVVPIQAEPLDADRWEMRLRCGECGTYRDVVVSDAAAQRYDQDLSRGMAEIAAALQREDQRRMSTEAQAFIAALEHDLIDAGDFTTG
jgi:hypothetical protein